MTDGEMIVVPKQSRDVMEVIIPIVLILAVLLAVMFWIANRETTPDRIDAYFDCTGRSVDMADSELVDAGDLDIFDIRAIAERCYYLTKGY